MTAMRTLIALVLFTTLSMSFSACTPTVGRPFPVNEVRQIEIGTTTKPQVRQIFGEPWRTGIEDGFRTWTYGEYHMKNTRDLVIRFDDQDVVKSYSFSSSFPEDKNL